MGKLMNAKEYEESLRKLNLQVYQFGKRITNVVDDPIIRPSMNGWPPPMSMPTSLNMKIY